MEQTWDNNALIRSGEAGLVGWSRQMLYSGFNILLRSVFWSAYFNGRSDNADVIPTQPVPSYFAMTKCPNCDAPSCGPACSRFGQRDSIPDESGTSLDRRLERNQFSVRAMMIWLSIAAVVMAQATWLSLSAVLVIWGTVGMVWVATIIIQR